MQIVIVGLGKVGRALTEQLTAEGHDIVAIDNDAELTEDIVNVYDVRGVAGNGACYDVQREAFEDGADLLIAGDMGIGNTTAAAALVGAGLGLAGDQVIGTRHTIARIRNPEYERQLRFMRAELGLSMVINPEKATAREIARVLRFPSAIKLEPFCRGRFELIEYRLGPGNPLAGMALADLYGNMHLKLLICAVARGREISIPGGSFVLQEGDKIYLTATPRDLSNFFRRLGLFKARAANLMIVGASRMAYYLIRDLRDSRMHITVIDSSAARCQEMSEKMPGVLVIHGDAADSELLNEEGLADMDAFVALTGLDETNIILSMYAAQGEHCKVIAKVNRPSFADLATANGMLDSVVSTSTVTTEAILQYVRAMQNTLGSNIKALHRIVGGQVEALEFGVRRDAPFAGVPLKDLPIRAEVLVAGIVRPNGETIIPSGSDTLQPGDDVVVVTNGARIHDLRDILQEGGAR